MLMWMIITNLYEWLREGFQKKRQIIPFWWISVLPPPLIHLGKINNIHIKEFFYPPSTTPPLALIHLYCD